ncbi:protein zntC-like isoform X2 [Portunus trituberculatus]|uniref:protein zntC-like isoform X2 n=1 Tax=Portunus trituberculatus TaxID=210409 RepID=UPI001E1D0665|nr:protein zntC-like isoform X2 [Portunus trituberculatus]
MELLTIKIIALTLLGVFSLFFGLLPLRLRKVLAKGSKRRDRVVSCLLCFGGGVLLATVFTHMLPETREGFAIALPEIEYPLTEVVICAGFFLIYFVEEFMHKVFFRRDIQQRKKLTKLAAAIEEESSSAPHHIHYNNNNNNSVGPSQPETAGREGQDGNQNSSRCSVYSVSGETSKVMGPKSKWSSGVDNPVFAGDLDATAWNPSLKETILSSSQNASAPPLTNGKVATPDLEHRPDKHVMQKGVGHSHDHGHGHGHSHMAISRLGNKSIASNLRSLLVILALSFHSVFEGLAVGLQVREVDVWYLLGAISAHKFVIAFCMGLELLASGTSAGVMVIYMVVFALVSPLGVAFGILVTENLAADTSSHLLTVTVLQGLAGGTILYVTFFEVLERERGRPGGRLLKFLFVLLGFSAMASLEAFGGHSHGGSGGHGHSHGPAQPSSATTMAAITESFDDDHHGHSHGQATATATATVTATTTATATATSTSQ